MIFLALHTSKLDYAMGSILRCIALQGVY